MNRFVVFKLFLAHALSFSHDFNCNWIYGCKLGRLMFRIRHYLHDVLGFFIIKQLQISAIIRLSRHLFAHLFGMAIKLLLVLPLPLLISLSFCSHLFSHRTGNISFKSKCRNGNRIKIGWKDK